MSGALLLVPNTCGVSEFTVAGCGEVLVLEDLLNGGAAGIYFRRLRLMAALHPAMRAEYDRKRHEYLRGVLAVSGVTGVGAVVVGTSPTDVDLLDFEQVCAVRLSDRGMREVSKRVYGDPMMLAIEHCSAMRTLDEAVDTWYDLTEWRELAGLVMREFPDRVDLNVNIPISTQRRILAEMLSTEVDAATWLEPDLQIDFQMRRHFLIADYDYLGAIRPMWRDPVVRVFGKAPPIEDVFRLPWFVVDPDSVGTLCFRTSVNGMPAVSTRGRSLVQFVRHRLASVFTTRELVGTWVGAILCDDNTAIDTVSELGRDTIAPVGEVVQERSYDSAVAVRVASEFAWAYSAVPDVQVAHWDGRRDLAGVPVLAPVNPGWANTMPLAALFSAYLDDEAAVASVVNFMRRMHAVPVTSAMCMQLEDNLRALRVDGVTAHSFDVDLTPMLPGYNYLACFIPSMRWEAFQALDWNPGARAMLNYGARMATPDGLVSEVELHAEAARSAIYSGDTMRRILEDVAVGARDGEYEAGFCYLAGFRREAHDELRRVPGPYPSYHVIFGDDYKHLMIDDVMNRLYVSKGAHTWMDGWLANKCGEVIHVSTDPRGILLRDYDKHYRLRVLDERDDGDDDDDQSKMVRVGADQCYSSAWYVGCIISTTVVVVLAVGVATFLLYMKFSGGKRRYR